ncbi:suppressor of fused domain protein [Stenotrophomonas indicatrix]|uniref:suppressor of fused domain protein n=1 Tax=Stenotrophomonas indicatrix TaxID=2045451 RepID=UPI001CBF78AA|nr:suppressor of fused domain protein [Stenotrophomonas indicatrix]
MGTVTEQHRAVAMHAMKIMGGDARPKVQAFYDDRRQRSVDILTTLNAPEAGLKSISSIGLSDCALRHSNGRELETHVELCACVTAFFWREGKFAGLQLPSLAINWLQCIAIHESERRLIEQIGADVFDDLLQRHEVDVFDMDRIALPASGAA